MPPPPKKKGYVFQVLDIILKQRLKKKKSNLILITGSQGKIAKICFRFYLIYFKIICFKISNKKKTVKFEAFSV